MYIEGLIQQGVQWAAGGMMSPIRSEDVFMM